MKKVLSIVIGIVFLSLTSMSYAETASKIGFVNLSRAFDEYQKTKDFDKSLETKGGAKQEQREKLVKEIRNMRDELELLNDKTKGKKEIDIESKMKSLQEFDTEAKTELMKERDNMVKDILKEMGDIIEEYGKQNGYSVILNDRVLLYGDKSIEITDQIIKILNERYKK